jgi:periplasmic protein TonB
MQGRLGIHRGSKFWSSRGAVLAGILVLHAGILALALKHRAHLAEPDAELVSISFLTVEPARARPAPQEMAPRLVTPTQAVWIPSEIAWEASEEPPVRAITVALQPVPSSPAPSTTAVETGVPLQISVAQYLRAPVLSYPPAALSARREGSVGLRVVVGTDGRVIDLLVEQSSGFGPFDEAACSAVRAALFKPYTVNGEPRVVLVRIPINFSLRRRGA